MAKTNLRPEPVALEETLATIRRRWGTNAICKLQSTPSVAVLPTGLATLDAALGVGGLPRGRLTALYGTPTSGLMTLGLQLAHAAQNAGELVALVNLGRRLDPAYVSDCGLDLGRLLLVLPKTDTQALAITHDLVTSRRVGLVLLNAEIALTQDEAHDASFRRLVLQLRPSAVALVVTLTQPIGSTSVQATLTTADVQLQVEKHLWLETEATFEGYATRLTILKNKVAPTTQGHRVILELTPPAHHEGL